MWEGFWLDLMQMAMMRRYRGECRVAVCCLSRGVCLWLMFLTESSNSHGGLSALTLVALYEKARLTIPSVHFWHVCVHVYTQLVLSRDCYKAWMAQAKD